MDEASSSYTTITNIKQDIPICYKLNESLYELYKPPGEPSVQVIFFHGFHGEGSDRHLSTWWSGDDSSLWPQSWLVDEFPNAQVLTISYNASLLRNSKGGKVEMFIIAEDLLSDLLQAKIGQDPRCPVVFVGHGFGVLAMKELCLHARNRGTPEHQMFLSTVKGFCFHSTPHHGIDVGDFISRFLVGSPLLDYLKTLSTSAARLNSEFDELVKKYQWQISGVGENLPIKLDQFPDFDVVPVASARYGDINLLPNADHSTVCKPLKNSSTFNLLPNADHITVCEPLKNSATTFNIEELTRLLHNVTSDSMTRPTGQKLCFTILWMRMEESLQKPVVREGVGNQVIKAICWKANNYLQTTFLTNLKGVVRYGTSHVGVPNLPTEYNSALPERLSLSNVETARLNNGVRLLRSVYKWATRVILPSPRAKKYCLRGNPDQQEKFEGISSIPSLDFTDDLNYVPMQTTLAALKKALQRARIVVLHGGPGSGKSSLARYLALRFQDEAGALGPDVECNSIQTASFPDGVAWLNCRPEASLSTKGAVKYLTEKVAFILNARRRHLFVLDNVWDRDLVENLLFDTGQVKYLITTQISTIWSGEGVERVKIQHVTLDDARQILGNYANFPGGVIPDNSELKNLVDDIIEAAESNPLALATVAMIVDTRDRNSVREWQFVRNIFMEYSRIEVAFDEKYPRSTHVSIKLVVMVTDAKNPSLPLHKVTSIVLNAIESLALNMGNWVNWMAIPALVQLLVMLLAEDQQDICYNAASAITHLARSAEFAEYFVHFASSLERLANLLVCENASIRQIAVTAVGNLARHNNVLLHHKMLETPGLLIRLVILLSENLQDTRYHDTLYQAARAIAHLGRSAEVAVRFARLPCGLERLVALLAENVEEDIQQQAMEAIASLATHKENWVHMNKLARALAVQRKKAIENLENFLKSARGGIECLRELQSFLLEQRFRRFITDVIGSNGNGYFVSKIWLSSLDEHQREEVMSVLLRAGYFEIYETDTTMFYERMEDEMQDPTICNDSACTSENKNVGDLDTGEVVAPDFSDALGKVEQTVLNIERQDGDLVAFAVKNPPFDNQKKDSDEILEDPSSKEDFGVDTDSDAESTMMQTNTASLTYSPGSLLEKGETPHTSSNDKLRSFKRALKNTGMHSYSVNTHWLSTLVPHQIEDLNSALSKARYSQTCKSSSTTYFERIQSQCANNPTNQEETLSSSEKSNGGGETECSSGFPKSGDFLSAGMNIVEKLSGMKNEIETSSKGDAKCGCHPQFLSVSFTSPTHSQTQPAISSSPGECNVTIRERKGWTISTRVDKDISMKTILFTGTSANSEVDVPLNVCAEAAVSCCITSDRKNVRIKFLEIRGEVEIDKSFHRGTNGLVLKSVRTNVDALIKNSNGDLKYMCLNITEDSNGSAWRRVLQRKDQKDLMWLELTGKHPKYSRLGSKTLELQYHVPNRLKVDLDEQSHGALILYFEGSTPVILHGEILRQLDTNSFLELHIRYQVEVSYNKRLYPLSPDDTEFVCTRRENKVEEFDCVLEIRTQNFSSQSSIHKTGCFILILFLAFYVLYGIS